MNRELESLIEPGGLIPEAHACLRRTHDLLVAAPPVELPGSLVEAPFRPAFERGAAATAAGAARTGVRRRTRRRLLRLRARHGATTVSFTVPYGVTSSTRWVVSELARGDRFPGHVLMTSA